MRPLTIFMVILYLGLSQSQKQTEAEKQAEDKKVEDAYCAGTLQSESKFHGGEIDSEKARKLIVDRHNQIRSQYKADAMIKMRWNEEIANQAQVWAEQCRFRHAMEMSCETGTQNQGQNMYGNFLLTFELFASANLSMYGWYDFELPYYNAATDECNAPPGYSCGHLRQVVWDNAREVGCGVHSCEKISNDGKNRVTMMHTVVCNYLPPGNGKRRPFTTDSGPCSKCADIVDGPFYCEDNLCVPKCYNGKCLNGGKKNDQCECECPKPWTGDQCQYDCTCEDTVPQCSQPQWLSVCGMEMYEDFLRDMCPKSCNLCADMSPFCVAKRAQGSK